MTAPQPHLEIDLAVARGDTYLHRGRFRPATIVTVGTHPMTTITLQGDGVPDFHEMLRLTEDGVILRFTPDLRVEVLAGPGQVLTTDALIEKGLARPSGEGYALAMREGGKAVVRMGAHKLMFRVEAGTDVEVRAVRLGAEEPPACPSCKRAQPLALTAGGAITVCEGCGTRAQFVRPGGAQESLEVGATRIGVSAALRIGEERGEEAAEQEILGADLPTFDAIQALKEDEGLRTMDAVQALRGEEAAAEARPAPRGPAAIGPSASPAARGREGASRSGAADLRGADLPTFDAITAIREEGMSTLDAVRALKPDAAGSPPAPRREETPAGRPARPVNLAEMVRQSEPEVAKAPAAGRSPVSTPTTTAEPQVNPASTSPEAPSKALETGRWEETLTIQAVRPKKGQTVLYITIGALAFGMALAFVAILILRKMGMLSF